MLQKRDSNPGVDVLATFSKEFPHYCLEWVLTGEGEMLKSEAGSERENQVSEDSLDLKAVRDELKSDLAALAEGMTKNFNVVSQGIMEGLKGQEKLLKFIEELDPKKIARASEGLEVFLRERE